LICLISFFLRKSFFDFLCPPHSHSFSTKASENDVLPLSKPLVAASGETVDKIALAKGTTVTVPIHLMNRLEAFWGPNAGEFIPERWLDDSDASQIGAREIQGHRHLLTFVDGPRTCLGKGFALAEFKVCVFVSSVVNQCVLILPRIAVGSTVSPYS
jgi:hypothetical protein